jgi:hypothetical protein
MRISRFGIVVSHAEIVTLLRNIYLAAALLLASRRVRAQTGADLMDPEHKQSSMHRSAPCNLRLSDNSQ